LNEISQGVAISISGLAITFLALGVFILVMLLLQRFFPPKPETEEGEEEDNGVVAAIETTAADDDGEITAAIAVAINYFRSLSQSKLGGSLEEGRGAWWTSNRIAMQNSRRPGMNRSNKL
jgi:sodium pump decarboxylase gamma subunit